jgi:hypothetical protein
MDAGNFIGRTIQIISKRTGRVVNLDLAIASCYPTPKDFQIFLIDLYMKDFGVYQAYSQIMLMYLNTEPKELNKSEILENKTIFSTIEAMFTVRDMHDKERERQEHEEMQEFIFSLTNKQK